MWQPEEILRVLDRGAASFAFPMLDNGYVYLAATRMTLYRSATDWALVFEVFGFSPRAGLPDVCVCTFASSLRDRDPPENYASGEAYTHYLAQHPNDDSRYFHPVAEGAWQDPESDEFVSLDAKEVLVRGEPVGVPSPAELAEAGISLSEPPRVLVFELCRFLGSRHRERVLATPRERRVSVPDELSEILQLNEWTHPDLVRSALPSQTESFVQIAHVLSTGDPAKYRPSSAPNTHWRNWPDGGTL